LATNATNGDTVYFGEPRILRSAQPQNNVARILYRLATQIAVEQLSGELKVESVGKYLEIQFTVPNSRTKQHKF